MIYKQLQTFYIIESRYFYKFMLVCYFQIAPEIWLKANVYHLTFKHFSSEYDSILLPYQGIKLLARQLQRKMV